MNIFLELFKLAIRIFVIWLGGALASHLSPQVYDLVNNTITKLGGWETVILAILATVGTSLWAGWLRLKTRYRLQIALTLPKGSTLTDVKNAADAQPKSAPMSVLTNPQK